MRSPDLWLLIRTHKKYFKDLPTFFYDGNFRLHLHLTTWSAFGQLHFLLKSSHFCLTHFQKIPIPTWNLFTFSKARLILNSCAHDVSNWIFFKRFLFKKKEKIFFTVSHSTRWTRDRRERISTPSSGRYRHWQLISTGPWLEQGLPDPAAALRRCAFSRLLSIARNRSTLTLISVIKRQVRPINLITIVIFKPCYSAVNKVNLGQMKNKTGIHVEHTFETHGAHYIQVIREQLDRNNQFHFCSTAIRMELLLRHAR